MLADADFQRKRVAAVRAGKSAWAASAVRAKHPIGKRYGSLTVVGYEQQGTAWCVKCTCDCGGSKTVKFPHQLASGVVQSCGCLQRKNRVTFYRCRSGKLSEGEAYLRYIYGAYRRGAADRNLVFDLSEDEVRTLLVQNCDYCGSPPSVRNSTKGYNGKVPVTGIDRVDNKIGYTADNVVPCCTLCNRAKGTMSRDEFERWLTQIVRHRA